MADALAASTAAPDIGISLLPIPQVNPQDAVGALTDVISAKKEEYAARAEALQKNTQIQNDFATKQDALTSDTIQAYDNMRKTSALPQGLTKILGLFDSSYNSQTQALTIEENTVKAQRDAARAKTLIEINNQLPDMKKAQADVAQQNFDLQTKLFTLAKDVTTANQGTMDLKLKAADLRIKMTDEAKKSIDFALKSMTMPQLQAELKKAQKGEGDFAPYQGLLEERIDDEVKTDLAHKEAVVSLAQHQQALTQGNVNLQNSTLDLAEKKLKILAERIPVAVAGPALIAAQQKGDINVTFGTGKDAVQIPTNMLAEAVQKQATTDAAVQATAIANQADQTTARLDKTTTLAANLAASDPRAAKEYGLINSVVQKFDPTNPGSLQQMNAVLAASETRLAGIQKDVEATYKTPEAKAAVGQFFRNGKFEVPGATSVVQDLTGIPGAAATMKFKSSQQVIDNAYAAAIAKQNIGNMPAFTGSQTSQNQIMTWALSQTGKTKDTLLELKQQVLADPLIMTQAGNQIRGTYKVGAVANVLTDLTKGPQAGIFNQVLKMIDNPAADPNNEMHLTQQDIQKGLKGPVGSVSTQKMQIFLERQSVLTKYVTDYNRVFLDALQARAVSAVNRPPDPSHTINDSALETHIFGQPAAQSVYSDFLGELRINAGAVHTSMQKAIQQDQARDPRAEANAADDALAISGVGLTPKQYEAIKNQAGGPKQSATGIPLTSDSYIKQLYNGGR